MSETCTSRDDYEDRLTDQALAEVLGGKRPPDLSGDILAAAKGCAWYARRGPRMAVAATVLVAVGAWGALYFQGTRRDTAGQEELVAFGEELTGDDLGVRRRTAETSGSTLLRVEVMDENAAELAELPGRHISVLTDAEKTVDKVAPLDLYAGVSHKQATGSQSYISHNYGLDWRDRLGAAVSETPPGELREQLSEPAPINGPPERDDLPWGKGPGAAGDRHSRIVENPFLAATQNPLSTFSIDVDTASYAKTRRYLLEANILPPPDAVRIEELVNYFSYDYPGPEGDEPFAAHVEMAACPWQSQHRLLRVGLKGKEIRTGDRPTSNLVFLLDVSGSMEPEDRLPRVRRSLRMLVEQLGENDRVAIVVYAGASGLVLPSTPGYQKEKILSALENLQAGGSTNGAAGIHLAYDTAAANLIKGGVNRVVLCTDGDFNVGVTSTADLERLAEEKAKGGVFLTVLGFGMGNHNDDLLEKLADKGNGNYGYVDSEQEAHKLLVDELGGTLVTIAKDVKIQIEFNPRQVASYRLIGYENRLLRAEDFNDDTKDAGEIGAGHSVTALYELIPAGSKSKSAPVDELKYQQPQRLTEASASGEWLMLKLRYKDPDGQQSHEPLVVSVKDPGHAFGQASNDFKFAAAVASFGMLLRNSQHQGETSYDAVLEIASASLGADQHGYRAGFLELVRKAKQLAGDSDR